MNELSDDFLDFLKKQNSPRFFHTDIRILRWFLRKKIKELKLNDFDATNNKERFLEYLKRLGLTGEETDRFTETLFRKNLINFLGHRTDYQWASIILEGAYSFYLENKLGEKYFDYRFQSKPRFLFDASIVYDFFLLLELSE